MTALSYVTITELATDGSSADLNGTATFTPNQACYAAGIGLVANVPIQGQVINGQLLTTSGGALQLLATDNTLTFTSLTGYLEWSVVLVLGGVEQAPWSFFLPSSPASVALFALANTSAGGGGGGGTVTLVSVATANGLAGTVADDTTTPVITLSTPVTGLLKGNGTGITAASAGTDYLAPGGSGAALTGITAGQVSGAAPLASPALTGTPTAPTAGALTASTQLATTAYADSAVGVEKARALTAEGLLAPLASPALTGTPTSPTASPGTSSTRIASTAYADAAVAVETSRAETAEALLAPKASPTFTGTVTVPVTANATDAAQKAYVDSVASGLDAKPSVTVTATGNLTLSGTQTVDGVALSAGNRVLCTGQSTSSQNGLWVVASGAWTRPADFASGSVQSGAFAFTEGGTVNGSSGWVLVGASPVTVDSTAQSWTQFSGAGEVNAGSGLGKSGNTISLTATLDQVPTAVASVPFGGQKATGLAAGVAGTDAATVGQLPSGSAPLAIGSGGTGQAAQQAALNALAGGTTSGQFLRGNGSNVQLSAIQQSDLAPVGSPAPSKYAPLLYGAVWNWPWRFWPDAYGMKMDGRVFEDATVGAGSLSTLTSAAQAVFTSADVTKSVLCYTGSGWYTGVVTAVNSPTSATVTPAFSGAVTNMGCIIATDDTAVTGGTSPVSRWYAAALAYAQAGAQEAELYLPPLISGWATPATLGTTTGGGNGQLFLGNITPGSALACSLVMRSDGKSAGPMHWAQSSHLLPGACIVSMVNNGSLNTTYGPTSVIGGPVSGFGGGGGTFSNLRFRLDGLTIATPASNAAYSGLELFGLGQASIGDYTYMPLGVPVSGGPWPQFAAANVPAYNYAVRMPAAGNNALSEIDQLTSYFAQIALVASEHTRVASMRTIYGAYGWLPMSNGGTMAHGVSVQNWACELVNYPIGSLASGFFRNVSPIGIVVSRLDLETYTKVINDAAGNLYGDVGFGYIAAAGSYQATSLYAAGTSMGVRLRRLEIAPGPIASPSQPVAAGGTAWLNGYYARLWVTATVSGGTFTSLTIDGAAEAGAVGAATWSFPLAEGHSYTPVLSAGTVTHTAKVM